MREIKFRAWDLKTKKMHTAENINFCGRKIVTVQYNPVKKICLDSAILMQYTGVKDKNGVKIYEGDVIRGHTGRYQVDCVVRWSRGNCGFIAEPTIMDRTYLCLNPGSTKSYEVIGNIYENPELVSNEADT